MQSVLSRIWTRIAVFISYDDNDYTTGTSIAISVDETLLPREVNLSTSLRELPFGV